MSWYRYVERLKKRLDNKLDKRKIIRLMFLFVN